jgi:GNAT superfamily N-acetyltransferase
MYFELVKKDYNWLENFCMEKRKLRITPNSFYWEIYALTHYQDFLTLSCIYSIKSLDEEYLGFAITPSYDKTILSSIYLDTPYRKKGIAGKVIDILNIKQLSCLTENKDAIKLYYKLGFKEIITNDPFKGSIKLRR